MARDGLALANDIIDDVANFDAPKAFEGLKLRCKNYASIEQRYYKEGDLIYLQIAFLL